MTIFDVNDNAFELILRVDDPPPFLLRETRIPVPKVKITYSNQQNLSFKHLHLRIHFLWKHAFNIDWLGS